MPQWIIDLIPMAPWLAAILFTGFLVWKIGPVVRKWSRFIDRVTGVPDDPKTGQKEIPGIFQRMDRQDELLETIKHELFPNSGKSLRDAVDLHQRQLTEHLASCQSTQTTINVSSGGTP